MGGHCYCADGGSQLDPGGVENVMTQRADALWVHCKGP